MRNYMVWCMPLSTWRKSTDAGWWSFGRNRGSSIKRPIVTPLGNKHKTIFIKIDHFIISFSFLVSIFIAPTNKKIIFINQSCYLVCDADNGGRLFLTINLVVFCVLNKKSMKNRHSYNFISYCCCMRLLIAHCKTQLTAAW